MKSNKKALLLTLAVILSSTSFRYRNNNEEIVETIEINDEIESVEEPIIKHKEENTNKFIEIDKDAYLKCDTVLYSDYEYGIYEIATLETYEKVHIISQNNDLAFVKTQDGLYGFIEPTTYELLPDNYVEVDISDQNLRVVYDNEEVMNCDVVTGNPNTPTDLGYTEILEKTYNRPLVGPTWNVPVHYFFPFNYSEEGFHDMTSRNAFGGDIYTYNGSHGCVNMSLEDAENLDKYTEVGTKVLIHK